MRVKATKKVTPITPVYKAKKVERREVAYQGDIDPAVIIHSSRTHRSVSDAFRGADYATPIWKCKTDWDRTKEYLTWIFIWGATLGSLYLFMTAFDAWAK